MPSLLSACAVALLSACAVGPDFARPAAPEGAGYGTDPLPARTGAAETAGGAAQRFVPGQDIPAQWWRLFHSEALNRLIDQALLANPSLAAAQAVLREAEENAAAAGGALYPSIAATPSFTRQKQSTAQFGASGFSRLPGFSFTPKPYNLYNASVTVSYTLDLFGGTRRSIEAAEAGAEAQGFALEASRLPQAANVVTAAIQEASLRAQIAATEEIVRTEREQLQVANNRFELGGVSRADVLTQQSALAATEATLPGLAKLAAQERNQLAAYLGLTPNRYDALSFDLAGLQLPEDLPVTLPSRLVEQRPDIRQAAAALHQATANLGVAIADMLPKITLSADLGSSALEAGKLFAAGNGAWSLASGVTQPIFEGGTLIHRRRAADAAVDAAAAQYRGVVVASFQDVANVLKALQADADTLAADVTAERAASEALNIAREQFGSGAIAYPTLLNAEQAWQQARITLVKAQAARYADTAALFQALGGGWWHQNPEVASGS